MKKLPLPMFRSVAWLIGLTATGPATAQSVSVVVPTGSATSEGASVEPRILGDYPGKTQLIIDRAKLGSLASRPIRRLILRRDAQTNDHLARGMLGGWIMLEVKASWTTQPAKTPDPRFARNHGRTKSPSTVYSGEFRVIDSPQLPPNTKVASFAPNVSVHIELQSPILPSQTGNLCVEFTYDRHSSKSAPQLWLVDMHREPPPTLARFGRSCWRRNSREPLAAYLSPSTAVGGTLRSTTFGPLTPLAVLVVGASNVEWGPMRLPFDLTGYGAPGCLLYVSWDLVVPTVTKRFPVFRDAKGLIDLPTPQDARLAGARLYSQWLFFDPSANALSMTMTNGVSVALAPTPPNLGAGMVQAQSPSATTGRVYVNRAPVIRLEDR